MDNNLLCIKRTIIMVCIEIGLLSFAPVSKAETVIDNSSKLLDLARKEFGTLTTAEEKLFRAVADGSLADYRAKKPEDNDLSNAKNWPAERSLKSVRITWLCINKEASGLVMHKGIQIRGIRIDGELDLQSKEVAFPLVIMEGAILDGIDLRHAEIRMLSLYGTHVGQIKADGLKVNGSVLLFKGFKAVGGVRLVGATIGGQLACENGEFVNPNGYALEASSLKVESSVYLRDGFKAEGEVCLINATIGQLDCNNGQFINPDGYALNADALKVEGSILLRNGFRAEGQVNFRGATIGGQLACTGGQFINPNGKAINADSLKVKSHVFLNDGFKAEGKIDLVGAKIGGCFKWHKVDSPEQVTLDLRSAIIGILNDEPNSWPNKGKLLLNGLTYSDFFDNCPKDAKTRIEWIRRQYNKKSVSFHPQPYEQLAEVLQKNGHENNAKKILIAKNKDKVKWGPKLTFGECLWYRIFGPMIGYGNRPLWAFYKGLCGVWFVGSILFWILVGWILFLIEHRKYPAIDSTNNNSPKFNPLVYSIDTFVPLVNLYQAKYWLPKSWFFRLYHWIHIGAGWILTTLLVLGLTGLIRK